MILTQLRHDIKLVILLKLRHYIWSRRSQRHLWSKLSTYSGVSFSYIDGIPQWNSFPTLSIPTTDGQLWQVWELLQVKETRPKLKNRNKTRKKGSPYLYVLFYVLFFSLSSRLPSPVTATPTQINSVKNSTAKEKKKRFPIPLMFF